MRSLKTSYNPTLFINKLLKKVNSTSIAILQQAYQKKPDLSLNVVDFFNSKIRPYLNFNKVNCKASSEDIPSWGLYMTLRGANDEGKSVPCAFIIATCFSEVKPNRDDIFQLEELAFYPVINDELLGVLKLDKFKLAQRDIQQMHLNLLPKLQRHHKSSLQLELFNEYCELMLNAYNSFYNDLVKNNSLAKNVARTELIVDSVVGYVDSEMRRVGLTSAFHDHLHHAEQVVNDEDFGQILDLIKAITLAENGVLKELDYLLLSGLSLANRHLNFDSIQGALVRAAKASDRPGTVDDLAPHLSQITGDSNCYFHSRYLTKEFHDNWVDYLICDNDLAQLEKENSKLLAKLQLGNNQITSNEDD